MSRWKKKKVQVTWKKKKKGKEERSGHVKWKKKKKEHSVTLKKTKKWEGIKVKLPQCSFPSLLFLPIWEEKFCGSREKIFSLIFHSPYFSLIAKQWKTEFSTQFSFLYFPSPYNLPNHTQCKSFPFGHMAGYHLFMILTWKWIRLKLESEARKRGRTQK